MFAVTAAVGQREHADPSNKRNFRRDAVFWGYGGPKPRGSWIIDHKRHMTCEFFY
jgi:hypothetical protein